MPCEVVGVLGLEVPADEGSKVRVHDRIRLKSRILRTYKNPDMKATKERLLPFIPAAGRGHARPGGPSRLPGAPGQRALRAAMDRALADQGHHAAIRRPHYDRGLPRPVRRRPCTPHLPDAADHQRHRAATSSATGVVAKTAHAIPWPHPALRATPKGHALLKRCRARVLESRTIGGLLGRDEERVVRRWLTPWRKHWAGLAGFERTAGPAGPLMETVEAGLRRRGRPMRRIFFRPRIDRGAGDAPRGVSSVKASTRSRRDPLRRRHEAQGDRLADRVAEPALEVTPRTLPLRRNASPPDCTWRHQQVISRRRGPAALAFSSASRPMKSDAFERDREAQPRLVRRVVGRDVAAPVEVALLQPQRIDGAIADIGDPGRGRRPWRS